jgi:hypothetical protein
MRFFHEQDTDVNPGNRGHHLPPLDGGVHEYILNLPARKSGSPVIYGRIIQCNTRPVCTSQRGYAGKSWVVPAPGTRTGAIGSGSAAFVANPSFFSIANPP